MQIIERTPTRLGTGPGWPDPDPRCHRGLCDRAPSDPDTGTRDPARRTPHRARASRSLDALRAGPEGTAFRTLMRCAAGWLAQQLLPDRRTPGVRRGECIRGTLLVDHWLALYLAEELIPLRGNVHSHGLLRVERGKADRRRQIGPGLGLSVADPVRDVFGDADAALKREVPALGQPGADAVADDIDVLVEG